MATGTRLELMAEVAVDLLLHGVASGLFSLPVLAKADS